MAQPRTLALAPGARVEIRDEEWVVRSLKPTHHSGQAVHVTGVSELVKDRDWIFLTALDDVKELKPEDTALVHDDSPHYRRTRLYLEALLRRSPATDDALYVGHRGAIDRTTYQQQPAAKALGQLRPRILMADGVGLGKTIEVGMLLSELIQRGRGDRILVVALKSILAQFQKELWARFTIPLVRLDSVGIQRVQSKIPSNMNPFYYFDRVIISIDTLKRDEKYRRYLEDCDWDVIVVDECQHVAIRDTGAGKSQRARLAELLATRSDGLIFTSATPHDGSPESFASLMNMLDPTAIADEENYTSDDVARLFIRRFKKDVAHETPEAFKERELHLKKFGASAPEDAAFETLAKAEFKTVGRQKTGKQKGILFRTLLLKSFLSSPAACASTIEHRLGHKDVQDQEDPLAAADRKTLGDLHDLVTAVKPAEFTKYGRLKKQLEAWGFGSRATGDPGRVVIFSERIDTLEFLHEHLRKDLGLSKDQVVLFHGSLDDQKQTHLVESFGTEDSPIRILLASDVASEGINLHYHCHRLIHFDLPWSLITLEQRNGRIDRYGQTETPELVYLLTLPGNRKLQGDLRVLERLIEKESHAQKNLGDVAWLMALHEAEKEEARIAKGIEEGEAPEQVIPDDPKHTDFMKLLFGEDAPKDPKPNVRQPVRLYTDELRYAREAMAETLDGDEAGAVVQWHEHLQGFTVDPPDDLLRRFDYLPPELRQNGDAMKLTADRDRVTDALAKARQSEGAWPEWQLWWEQHPVAEWLDDRVLGKFGRHEAPILRLGQGLQAAERVFLFQGVISSQRSRPILVEWFGVPFINGQPGAVRPLRQLVEATNLGDELANPGGQLPLELIRELEGLRVRAVEEAGKHMAERRQDRMAGLSDQLREGLARLKRWHDMALPQIELSSDSGNLGSSSDKNLTPKQLKQETQRIKAIFEEHKDWINEDMRTVPRPFLRLVAVLVPQEAN